MIAIQKKAEPAELAELRHQAERLMLSPEEAYDTLKNPLKAMVRDSLVDEQGQLCAYCMCRIPRTDIDPGIAPIVIEHMDPRNSADHRDAGQGLDYNNFVAVCHGNRGAHGTKNKTDLICDAHKDNLEFRKVNPCKPETLQSIFYTLDGKIDANDMDVKSDLLDILNLNCPSAPLIAERKAALDSMIDVIGQDAHVDEIRLLKFCESMLGEFYLERKVKTPYVGILIWYLQTMIESLQRR